MSKQLKKLKKDAKKLMKRLESCKGLTIRSSFDSSASIVRKGHESAPLFTLSAKGDYSIPVIRLILILLGISAAVTAVTLTVKTIAENLRERKRRRMREKYLRENDEIAF